jgi:hypothetical protein
LEERRREKERERALEPPFAVKSLPWVNCQAAA